MNGYQIVIEVKRHSTVVIFAKVTDIWNRSQKKSFGNQITFFGKVHEKTLPIFNCFAILFVLKI